MWWLTIFLASFSAADQYCRVLSLSGGGSFGSYEAGVFQTLVNLLPAQEVSYNALVGISAGSLNSLIISQYAQGSEVQAATQLSSVWANFNGSQNAYVDWPGGIITGIELERGLVDNSPLRKYISKYFAGTIRRNVTVGTVNLNNGNFDNFNETVGPSNLIESAICSASIPIFFPFQTYAGGQYVDGGTLYNMDIDSAVNRCLDVTGDYSKIIVDIAGCHHYSLNASDTELKSYEVLQRVQEIHSYDKGLYELYYALTAFPQVNFRYYILPSQSLGKVELNFTNEALANNYNIGVKDATYMIKNNVYAKDVINQWIASNGGIIKKSQTIHI